MQHALLAESLPTCHVNAAAQFLSQAVLSPMQLDNFCYRQMT